MDNAEYRDIKGYKGLYQVSNTGKVWSVIKQKHLKPIDIKGYDRVVLYSTDGRRKNEFVHRLVAITFIPNEDKSKTQVNHIDENKHNNSVENLEWVSSKENCNYGSRNAKISKEVSKPVSQYTLDGEYIQTFPSVTAAANSIGGSKGNISSCCRGNRNSANGYIWRKER